MGLVTEGNLSHRPAKGDRFRGCIMLRGASTDQDPAVDLFGRCDVYNYQYFPLRTREMFVTSASS